ncbi:MAG: M28 family metallopeptidase [Chloroflexia bacterium]
MEEQLAAVQYLAQEIGPRPPTSASEARAAAYVNSRMRQAGLEVEVQPFRALPTLALPLGLLYLAAALTPLLYVYSRPVAVATSLLALLVLVVEAPAFPTFSSCFPLGRSQNVIGTRPAAQESRRHLIFLAHLDTGRAGFLYHPRLVADRRRLFFLRLVLFFSLPLLAGMGWWLGSVEFWYAQWVPAGILAWALLLLLVQEAFRPYVAGANDNASGLSVLLRLADELKGLQHTDLWLVATGCQEAGQVGAGRFLDRYPFPRESTYVVNLDSVGGGNLHLIVEAGLLRPRRCPPHFAELAGEAEAEEIIVDADPWAWTLADSDAVAALRRGLPALSITALEEGRPAHWHRPEDTFAHIQPELLERAARLAVSIARRLDRLPVET